MKGFGRRKKMDHLERRLRDDRPVPPQELLHEVVSRLEGSRPASSTRIPLRRLGLAALSAAMMLAALAAFGGAGFAASGVSGAASSTADAILILAKSEQSGGQNGNFGGQNGDSGGQDDCDDQHDSVSAANGEYCKPRKTICHVNNNNSKTLALPVKAANKHLEKHEDDYEGPCVA